MIYIKKEKLEEIIKHQNEIIEDLQARIEEAINWIGNNKIDYEYEDISFSEWNDLSEPNDLLEILKGSDKE